MRRAQRGRVNSFDQRRGLLFGSFVGDSLALGAHWIYEASRIEDLFGRISDLTQPHPEHYHEEKKRGEQSHYGDQTLILMESIRQCDGFNFDDFATRWRDSFDGYRHYRDNATKITLNNLYDKKPFEDSGSFSTEIGAAARIAPIVFALAEHEEDVVASVALQQCSLTHRSPEAADATLFFTRVAWRVLRGSNVTDAIHAAGKEAGYQTLDIAAKIDTANRRTSQPPKQAMERLGKDCDVTSALPAIIYFALKYPTELETCLIENTMVGGDSCARGMILGTILGARNGESAIPARWIEGLAARPQLEDFARLIVGAAS